MDSTKKGSQLIYEKGLKFLISVHCEVCKMGDSLNAKSDDKEDLKAPINKMKGKIAENLKNLKEGITTELQISLVNNIFPWETVEDSLKDEDDKDYKFYQELKIVGKYVHVFTSQIELGFEDHIKGESFLSIDETIIELKEMLDQMTAEYKGDFSEYM